MFLTDFLDACRQYAARPAMVIGGQPHTYGELGARVAGIWVQLAELPVDETRVGVIAHDHIATYAAVFATMLTGRAYVPLNPGHPPSRNRSIVEQAGLRTVCTAHHDISGCTAIIGREVDSIIATKDCTSDEAVALLEIPVESIAYLLFTSGSSGEPKGVPITFGNVDSFLDAFFASAGGMNQDDRTLQMFDLTFDFSVVAFMAPLVRGACMYTVPPSVIKFMFIAELLEEEELTQLPLVPSVLSQLRPYFGEMNLSKVRHTFFCGEALHVDLFQAWAKAATNSRLTNYYGPTEATVFAMYYQWDPSTEDVPLNHNGIVSIGRPMEKMGALVVDADGCPVSDGVKGELCLTGAQVTPGYFQDPGRNQWAFFPVDGQRCYRTGDVVRREPDGMFAFLGRVDDQVKVQGYRVELAEIEHHARELVHPRGAVVVDVKADDGVSHLHLFLEAYEGETSLVTSQLKRRLPPYMVPRAITVVPSLPLNANGKIDRRRLRALAAETGTSSSA